eukprot:Rhum_TRINITY_DN14643_c10_g1::Rhum_TRINITY_DN14643_c10_g1_i1::g.107433::m.107433
MGSDGGGGRGGWETGGYGGFQVHLSEQLPAFGVLHHNPPIIVKAVELALVCAWRGVEAALGGHGGELVVEVQPALLRHKGDRHLACEKGVEVKAVKELLLLEGLNVLEAAVFAAVQQAAAQRPRRGGHAVRELQGLRLDKLVHLIQVLAVEGRQTADHLVQKDAQRPPVHRLSVASRRVQELGSQVLGGAAEGGGLLLAVDARLRKAEVGDAAVALPVEHAVLRLQVPVDDVQRVQVPQRQPDLRRVELRPALRERPHLRQVVEQLAAGQEVEDEEQRLLRLERKVQLHNVRVVDRPQDVLLRLHVLHEPLPQDQLLRHALHRVDLLRVLLPHLHHLAERPLAHHRQQVEVLETDGPRCSEQVANLPVMPRPPTEAALLGGQPVQPRAAELRLAAGRLCGRVARGLRRRQQANVGDEALHDVVRGAELVACGGTRVAETLVDARAAGWVAVLARRRLRRAQRG